MQTSWAVQVYAEGRILRLAQSVDNVLFPIAVFRVRSELKEPEPPVFTNYDGHILKL